MKKNYSGARVPIFDGLKGLAILLIIAYYFFEHIVPGGFLAVNTFLVIAGYFNFRHFYLADQAGQKPAYGKFLIKRFERLFFPLLAMIALTTSYILLFSRDFLSNVREMGLSALAFFNNYYQIINEQSYFVQAANPSPFTHLWYVSLYGQLIFLIPLLIIVTYIWHKKPQITINILLIVSLLSMVLMGILYQPGQDPTAIYYGLPTRLSAFTMGGALGLLLPAKLNPKPIPKKVTRIMNLVGLVSFVLGFLMVKFMFGTKPFAYQFGLSLFTLISCAVILSALHPSTIWNKLYSFKPLVWIGKRSFSYYLWYYPVYLLMPHNISLLNQYPGLNYAVQFLLIVVLAELTYQIFEQRRVSLPIGQDFNWKKMRYQLNYLRSHPQSLYLVKFLTGFYCFTIIMGAVGMGLSSQAKGNENTKEIEESIQNNLELASQTQTTAETAKIPKVVNNIEGLSQEVLLYANGIEITFIGDSILAAAAQRLQEVFPKAIMDPQVGRQLYNSYDVVYNLKQVGQLKPTVVTLLGSNGTFTKGQIDDYIEAIGNDHDQYFINVTVERPWTEDANRQLMNASQRHGNVKVIDWASYSKDHLEWFASDGYHLNDEGSLEFAKFLAKEIYRLR